MTIDELFDQAERSFYEGGDHQPSLVLTDGNSMPLFAGYVNLSDWITNVSVAITGMQRTSLEAAHAVFTFPAEYHSVPHQTVLAHRGQPIPVKGPGSKIIIFGVVTLTDELAIEYRVLDEERQSVPDVQLGDDPDDPILTRVRRFRAIYAVEGATFEEMIATLHHDGILDAGIIFDR